VSVTVTVYLHFVCRCNFLSGKSNIVFTNDSPYRAQSTKCLTVQPLVAEERGNGHDSQVCIVTEMSTNTNPYCYQNEGTRVEIYTVYVVRV
jgi:hypothetical protein